MGKLWVNYIRSEDGAAAAEYALILAIVGAGISVAAIALKDSIVGAFTSVTAVINAAF